MQNHIMEGAPDVEDEKRWNQDNDMDSVGINVGPKGCLSVVSEFGPENEGQLSSAMVQPRFVSDMFESKGLKGEEKAT